MTSDTLKVHVNASLNPFEFRASIQYGKPDRRSRKTVSIPLNSGHRFNPAMPPNALKVGRLNPFEFRASIQ